MTDSARHPLRQLIPYLWPYRWRIGLALALLLSAKFAAVGVPLVMKGIVDALDGSQPFLIVPLGLLAAYGALRVVSTLFQELREVVFARVMHRTTRRVTLAVFSHLHALSLRFHMARQTGGISRDIERGTKAIGKLLDWTIYSILPIAVEVSLVTGILIWRYDIWFAVVTLSTLSAYAVFTYIVTDWRTQFFRRMNEADSRANTRAVDSLINYETVKYFNNETHEARRYDQHLVQYEEAAVMSRKSLAILNAGQALIVAGGVTLLMWRATVGVVDGTMTLGDLVLVNAFLIQLSAPLFLLGMVYREVKQALTDVERMFGLLRENREVQDRDDAVELRVTRPEVRFEGVDFAYDERRQILHGVDFSIPPGHTVAVVGHSGSGKSTLSRLMYRFYDVSGGRISIDGTDIRDLSQQSLRSAIAIVPQDTVLFNDSILYNIQYGRPEAGRDDVIAAARAAHIHDFIESLPDGYDSEVGERGLKLSGGEKQRVAIARALLKNPAILIFDEATSALDSKSEKAIQAELARIAEGRTTLVIAHRLSTVMDADQILVLDQGRIVERGNHQTLLARDGHYAQMWRLQQRESAESLPSV
jgi:ATP-binding cassette, subfamily B, heavy metal transporter